MESISLEQAIQQYIPLKPPNSNGWHTILCKVCNDPGKKGPRAGFKFDNGSVIYHCFNCSLKSVFGSSSTKLPKVMEQILHEFGVPDQVISIIQFNLLKNIGNSTSIENKPKQNICEPDEIPLPTSFYLLRDASPDDIWAKDAYQYLEQRKHDPNSYPFMLSEPLNTTDKKLDKWVGRLIIPIYKNNKLIFYQGRALQGLNTNKKYESPNVTKSRILFGFDQLFSSTDSPLFIMEGFFDAHLVAGIALLGNELSKTQIEWINRSKRKKVYIPDRYGDGYKIALDAIDQQWNISTPLIEDTEIKDINEAIIKYGKMYVTKSILDNISSGDAAKIKLGIWSNDKKGSKEETKRPSYKKRDTR